MSTAPLPRLITGYDKILHGGDYNPDQWLHAPEVIDEDFRLMRLAGCNAFSVGIFGWTSYETREGEYNFGWLDGIMDRMAEAGSKVLLATPSGGKPAWMARKYPEIRRVGPDGVRDPQWHRHNHCWSSPVYREKVRAINTALAKRYASHPALGLWHISNELGNDKHKGQCFCDLCLTRWQDWLRQRYGTIDALNQAWWTAFWSHTFTDWAEIDPRDVSLDTLALDWLRFTNWQFQDWYAFEAETLRPHTKDVPISTNFMGLTGHFDYAALAQHVDFVMDDQYPCFDLESPGILNNAANVSFKDHIYRCFKTDRPWMLVESCPDAPQWRGPLRLKPATVHQLEMFQALGHGAEGTLYFQWRKCRGSREKLHGAVVDHAGTAENRVFRSVEQLGKHYERLAPILGSTLKADVGMVFDREVSWSFQTSEGTADCDPDYAQVALQNYRPYWDRSVPVNVFDSTADFSGHKLLILPQLWMLKPGVAERLTRFVEDGGTLVATPYLGACNESNLCFTGGWPGDGLGELFGVWNEENDTLLEGQTVELTAEADAPAPLHGLIGENVFAVLHARGATVLARYGASTRMFAGMPALTVNRVGKGEAWYVGARLDAASQSALAGFFIDRLGITGPLETTPPVGVSVQRRHGADRDFLFVQNFTLEAQTLDLGTETGTDMLTGNAVAERIALEPAGSCIIEVSRS